VLEQRSVMEGPPAPSGRVADTAGGALVLMILAMAVPRGTCVADVAAVAAGRTPVSLPCRDPQFHNTLQSSYVLMG